MKLRTAQMIWIGGAAVLATLLILPAGKVQAAGQALAQAPPQQARPAVNAEAQRVFASNCAFCHGPDAHGGAEGGPDLTKSAIAMGDVEGFNAFLKVGRAPKMPAFDLPEAQVETIHAFIRSQRMTGRAAIDPMSFVVGDAAAGKAYFNGAGKCTTCHSVTGDLRTIGTKYPPQTLQGRMVLPRADGGWPKQSFPGQDTFPGDMPRTADVMVNGKAVSGEILRVSDFLISLKLADGTVRTIMRDNDEPKVVIHDPAQAHLDMMGKWTETDMHNVLAYLVTLK